MAEGEPKRAKKEPLSPEDIIRLPVDVRVEVLSRVDRLEDLFALGRQMPVMKAFMKRYDVFGKWFRYHTGFSNVEAGDIDGYVANLIGSLTPNDGGGAEIVWLSDSTLENITLIVRSTSVEIFSNVPRLRLVLERLGVDIRTRPEYSGEYFEATNNDSTIEPSLQCINIARMIDKQFPPLARVMSKQCMFNHNMPFDLLALCHTPRIYELCLAEDDRRQSESDDGVASYNESYEDLRNKHGLGVVAWQVFKEDKFVHGSVYSRLQQGLTSGEWTVQQVLE